MAGRNTNVGGGSSGGVGGGLNSILVTKLGLLSHPLSPMYTNIVSALVTILYVKTILEIAAYVRSRSTSIMGVEWSRKFVHFAACSYVLFWPLFDASHWGWRLNVTVPVVMSLRLLYKVRGGERELSRMSLLCCVQQYISLGGVFLT